MSTKDDDKSDWTPVLHGDVYCSPRCGARCTIMGYRIAEREGAALAASLGTRWRAVVHENLGWHWYAEHVDFDHFAVHANADDFWADLTIDGKQWTATTADPNTSAKAVILAAMRAADVIKSALLKTLPGQDQTTALAPLDPSAVPVAWMGVGAITKKPIFVLEGEPRSERCEPWIPLSAPPEERK